ncbi:MAG: hypothetical protein S4CHLAM45_11860 [Chlamydiales bacterium]|nr:hypothetical protein [Chlamydiales bacterium]MCH9619678.1 hypothetical protein [Chlamydiales bacterium]MCH9623284.1 hypothetical protein [Chlamydiales bacterium]
MAERPLDCSECKKAVSVHFTEIVEDKETRLIMCNDCPHLEKRLHGSAQKAEGMKISGKTALACGNCGTTLDSILMGHPLGCFECYDIFNDVITDGLIKEHRISRHLTVNARTQPLHIGRVPGDVCEISPTLRLIALNEALDETLIREDYEQAALLRDQIDKLKKNDGKK